MDSKNEKLCEKFRDLYRTWQLLVNIDSQIESYILSKLPPDIAEKIEYIHGCTDYDDFIELQIPVCKKDLKDVLKSLKETFPGWNWYEDCDCNYSQITLYISKKSVMNQKG